MNSIFFDSGLSDDARRRRLYDGQLFVYSPRDSAIDFCEFARGMIKEAFDGLDPETAQYHLPVEEYAAILAALKPAFIHHPKSKQFVREILRAHGCDMRQTYFDVPRMRTATSDDYLTTGIAYAFHPHRDTWYSAPHCQINWWLPIYDIGDDNGMAFHPGYWDQPVANGSNRYNYDEWSRNSRPDAARHIRTDTRDQPRPEEPMELDPQVRPVCATGGLILFSGAQMHSSVPNTSGRTRFSIDFRTIHLQDAMLRQGAPNIDAFCTGTTLRDFLRADDLERVPEHVALLYDETPCQSLAEVG